MSSIPRNPLTRLLAVGAAVALVPALWFGAFLVLLGGFIYAQFPNAAIPPGDPCCDYPQTWGAVGSGLISTILLVGIEILLLCAAASLLLWAVGSRRLRARHVRRILLWSAPLTAVAFGASVGLSSTNQPTDCATFTISAARLHSPDRDVRREEARGIEECQFSAQTPAEVRDLLGEPERVIRDADGGQTDWRYRDLEVTFEDGEAVYAGIYPPEERD